MSHNYLLDLSEHIDARINELTAGSRKTVETPEHRQQTAGRVDALKDFQALLCRNFYPKLPKRLYRRLSETNCTAQASRGPDESTDTHGDVWR